MNQITLDQAARRNTEREFQRLHKQIFDAPAAMRQQAIDDLEKVRTELILIYSYGLEDLAKLVDEIEGKS